MKKMFGCLALLLVGCASTPPVRVLATSADLPEGCELLGQVSDGTFASYRSRAFDLGADHVVIQRTEYVALDNIAGTRVRAADAYRCAPRSGD